MLQRLVRLPLPVSLVRATIKPYRLLLNKRNYSTITTQQFYAAENDAAWNSIKNVTEEKPEKVSYTPNPTTFRHDKVRIGILGVGGGGCNSVENMRQSNLTGVEFFVCNTDMQALTKSGCENKIQIGAQATGGLGSGAQPHVGRRSAEESIDHVLEQLGDLSMLFICAGLGGGTGTGASPVIAAAARKRGILTIAVITTPFDFEGNQRMSAALDGLRELERAVDTLIIVPNENIFNVAGPETPVVDAFKMNDDIILEGIRGVTDIAVKSGLINLDFADIKTVMQSGGRAFMGTGFGFDSIDKIPDTKLHPYWLKQQAYVKSKGALTRGQAAVFSALQNPLLDMYKISQAQNVILSITGNKDTTLAEIKDISNIVKKQVGQDTSLIIGAAFDETITNSIKVSLVVTGIPRTDIKAIVDHVHHWKPQEIKVEERVEPQESWIVRFFKKHW
jgi:cell division protein FtsZ